MNKKYSRYITGALILIMVQNRRLYYGTFHNDVYGTYALCAVPSIRSAIEIRTKNGIILFNYESEKVTAALSTSLTEFVSEKQQ